MTAKKGIEKICIHGHHFFKSSSCPVCPICEAANKPDTGFMSEIAAPARRALLLKGIDSIEKLKEVRLEEIKLLHGIGPGVLEVLRKYLTKSET
ncbi:MAG: hypothetical protein KG003_07030 [Bacteroidetes bacterium]|nr:hypothetical protein [Bacteroidota bacterium]